MSYEVYVKVEHHDKHYYGDEPGTESWCSKMADGPEPLVCVAETLRDFADSIDPRFVCKNCGKTRGEHLREGHLYRCFNRYGPIAKYDWWLASPAPEDEAK